MRKSGINFALIFTLICSGAQAEPAVRPAGAPGRPILGNGTVLTASGTPFRGAYWSLDAVGALPDRDCVREIREYGLNALHVYAERHDSGVPAGSYVEQMDAIARWCGEDGLYCVITIGCGGHNGSFDLDFARQFWNAYAHRYRDMPWVVYEIHNEPYAGWRPPYDEATLAMEQEMYDIIRRYAPETMVLFFTYSGALSVPAVRQDIRRLRVDWSNAAVAFHGFGLMTDAALPGLKAAGLNLVCTELGISSPFSDDQVNVAYLDMCERNGVSWLSFMQIELGYLKGWRFKREIDARRFGWKPDTGTWPAGPSLWVPPVNLALGKKTVVSSVENFQGRQPLLGEYAVDGDETTRWGSAFADDQYIIVDLGRKAAFDVIVVHWDGQYAVNYDVLASQDLRHWDRLYTQVDGRGGDSWLFWKERIRVSGAARYLKLVLKKRRMEYGFSIRELGVYTSSSEVSGP